MKNWAWWNSSLRVIVDGFYWWFRFTMLCVGVWQQAIWTALKDCTPHLNVIDNRIKKSFKLASMTIGILLNANRFEHVPFMKNRKFHVKTDRLESSVLCVEKPSSWILWCTCFSSVRLHVLCVVKKKIFMCNPHKRRKAREELQFETKRRPNNSWK